MCCTTFFNCLDNFTSSAVVKKGRTEIILPDMEFCKTNVTILAMSLSLIDCLKYFQG